jgi:hypothetical protein
MNSHKILVQSLRGSQAQVLWAFCFAMAAMDMQEVISWTGLKRQTCAEALTTLEAGFLGTQTLAHGRKVWVLKSEMLPLLRDVLVRLEKVQVIDGNSEKSTELVDVYEKRTSGDAVIILNPPLSTIKDSSVNNNNKAQMSVKRTSGSQVSEKRTPDEFAALLDALKKYQIVGKKKDELIACEWVTAAYVLAHVEFSIAEGHGKYSVGIAINRMLEEMEQPARRENSHIENCQCDACKIEEFLPKSTGAGYSGGMFAEYFNHEPTAPLGCLWRDDSEYVFPSGHPFEGQHQKLPACRKPLKPGSHHWCEEHYEIGVETYGTGQISEEEI